MTDKRQPPFDEIAAGLDQAERARLQRAHELLLAAGPPPELPSTLAAAPHVDDGVVVRLRARWATVALAAALGLAVFAIGLLVGDRIGEPGTFDVVALSGTARAPDARGSIEIFDLDAAGNWPMEVSVSGLGPTPGGGRYELWLTRGGELVALCGSFLAEPDGTTVVPMNAPWRLDEFDGWVVVEEETRMPVLSA